MLRRGFKAEAERISADLRNTIDVSGSGSIDPVEAATSFDVSVVSADDLLPRRRLEELDALQPGCFSACTFTLSPNRTVIVYNPLSALTRRRSDIAHELSHIMLNHRLSIVEHLGETPFLVCDATQEEEANWLSGCLLLPRHYLLESLRHGDDITTIANNCGVSEQFARWRVNVTGVKRQLGRSPIRKRRGV